MILGEEKYIYRYAMVKEYLKSIFVELLNQETTVVIILRHDELHVHNELSGQLFKLRL
jgi:hypothetical protein